MAEKDWISRYFAPIATPGAREMKDDAGLLMPADGWQIATTDALVEGVHFLTNQSLSSVAKKLVRVNVSDLLAKGAVPREALLTLGWPSVRSEGELAEFAGALSEECKDWQIGLVGGDTVSSPNLVLSLTMIGGASFQDAEPVWQTGAKPNDVILLTGRIGGNVGLKDAREGKDTPAAQHYLEPQLPPAESAELISRFASASTDVSDGVFSDFSNLLENSGVGGSLNLEDIRLWGETGDISNILTQCTSGDDYQIICTARPENSKALIKSGIFYPIGYVKPQSGLSLTFRGEDVNLPETLGFEHGR